MISKTHRSAQQPRGRQLNAKVCGCKSAIFLILLRYDHFVQTTITRKRPGSSRSSTHRHFITKLILIIARSYTITQRLLAPNSPWSIKLFTAALASCCPLRRTPFSNVVRMRTRSLVHKPKITVIGLGARLAHVKSRVDLASFPGLQSPNAVEG